MKHNLQGCIHCLTDWQTKTGLSQAFSPSWKWRAMTLKNGNRVLAKSMRTDMKTTFSNLFTNQDLEWGDYPAKVERGNSNGLLLLPCATHDLVITNTISRILNHNKTSWMYPHSRHWHLIDYVIQKRGTGMTWEWQRQCALQTVELTID